MANPEPANKIITDKNGHTRKLPRSAWKPGQSGNPAGRPKDGQSWAGIIDEIAGMAPDDIARMVGTDNDLGRAFLQMPRKVQMRYLIIARTIAALMFDPSKGLLDTLMERTEGKITEHHDITTGGERLQTIGIVAVDYRDSLLQLAPIDNKDSTGGDDDKDLP